MASFFHSFLFYFASIILSFFFLFFFQSVCTRTKLSAECCCIAGTTASWRCVNRISMTTWLCWHAGTSAFPLVCNYIYRQPSRETSCKSLVSTVKEGVVSLYNNVKRRSTMAPVAFRIRLSYVPKMATQVKPIFLKVCFQHVLFYQI